MCEKFRYHGYTEAELQEAFKAVRGPDWRDPINALIVADDLAVTQAAIVFYTATQPAAYQFLEGYYLVTATGYRAGPAGDH